MSSFVYAVVLKELAYVTESESEFKDVTSIPVAVPIAVTRSPVPPETQL